MGYHGLLLFSLYQLTQLFCHLHYPLFAQQQPLSPILFHFHQRAFYSQFQQRQLKGDQQQKELVFSVNSCF